MVRERFCTSHYTNDDSWQYSAHQYSRDDANSKSNSITDPGRSEKPDGIASDHGRFVYHFFRSPKKECHETIDLPHNVKYITREISEKYQTVSSYKYHTKKPAL